MNKALLILSCCPWLTLGTFGILTQALVVILFVNRLILTGKQEV